MADQKVTALTEDTAPTSDDLLYTVTDPAGTPASRKATVAKVASINPYCFRAYASVATTLTDNTDTKIALATEVYDYNGNFASSTYTAPLAGVYHFDARWGMGTIATGVDMTAKIYVNGAEAARGQQVTAITNGGADVSCDLLLAASDTVEFYGFQNSAGDEATQTGANFVYLSGHLVHRTA